MGSFWNSLGEEKKKDPIYVKTMDGNECTEFNDIYSAIHFFEQNERHKTHMIVDKEHTLSIDFHKTFKETSINSSVIDWNIKKREFLSASSLFAPEYNVNKAKQILKKFPRIVLEFDYQKHLDLSCYKLPKKYNHANLDIPIILGQDLGEIILIDGLHRLQKAIKTKKSFILAVLLTDSETEEIME